jgi:hypothetical protein
MGAMHLLDLGANYDFGCNGLWCLSGTALFHSGMYLAYAAYWFIVLYSVWYWHKSNNGQKEVGKR